MADKQYSGLTAAEVLRSRQEHGRNILTPVAKEPVWKMFLSKFNDPIIKLLLAAAVLSLGIGFFDGHFSETIGIIVAVLLATGVSFWFEYDAKRKFEILNVVNDETPVKVIRDGIVMQVPKRDIVVGDVILLESGDEVPADALLMEAVSLTVDESSLTGEPSATKTTDSSRFDSEATYPPDMVMRGSTVTGGHGVAVVTAVGDATEDGKVAEQATVDTGGDTPLNLQLRKLSSLISRIGSVLAVVIFVILVIKGVVDGTLTEGDWYAMAGKLLQIFMVCVAILVMAVPEGLPMSITLSLAMSMRRMLRSNNLVRRMHACETMGAVTVICTDKTGTLTMNRMSVAQIVSYNGTTEKELAMMMAANSTAYLDGEGKTIGNPTEGALLTWMRDRGYDYAALRRSAGIVDQITFSTERKYMATLVSVEGFEGLWGGSGKVNTNSGYGKDIDSNKSIPKRPDSGSGVTGHSGKYILLVKGAPEVVYAMCDGLGTEGAKEKLAYYQGQAMRTLGFASVVTDAGTCEEAIRRGGLTYNATAAISDPVRPDVPGAVRSCLDAGIRIKVVTGDTTVTATRIASEIGLWEAGVDGPPNIITGPEFEAGSDEQMFDRVGELKIMARARPLDKQRLVKLLQQSGEVVAVTGDGTNDAPALNFADVGLAMGTGTSVAKQAGDIILLDDSFTSIATAVLWGRSLYRNIQRFVMFQLTVNFSALAIVFIGSIFGSGMLLTVTQILWVNIIMDTFAAIALASLPPDPEVMKDVPRSSKEFIIGRGMMYRIFGIGTVMVVTLLALLFLWRSNLSDYRLSVFFTVFVMLQFWNLFNARGWRAGSGILDITKSKGFLLILALILIGQILIVTYGGEVFRTVPVSLRDWVIITASTSGVALIGLFSRLFLKKIGRATLYRPES
ncbi:MAG: cation-translocating P-type ATPase [Rikenellaceae bacterium]|nr:cation-translocating P-type ATPase [Rikenellaceae bacterium]